jgi:hypothetical protein
VTTERPDSAPITVDIAALRHARTERILERDTTPITDFGRELARLKEFAVLSTFARAKTKDN